MADIISKDKQGYFTARPEGFAEPVTVIKTYAWGGTAAPKPPETIPENQPEESGNNPEIRFSVEENRRDRKRGASALSLFWRQTAAAVLLAIGVLIARYAVPDITHQALQTVVKLLHSELI